MSLRTLFAVTGFAAIALATSPAQADCAATCGSICNAVDESVFVRAEVLSTSNGYSARARVAEILGGRATVDVALGDELDVNSQVMVGVGDSVFTTLSRFSDSVETYVWNVSWPIRDGMVICDDFDPTVPLDQYLAMATSDDCLDIARDLEVEENCFEDVNGCAVGGGAAGGLAAALGLALVLRRRSRAANRTLKGDRGVLEG
jgi:hypothetical protein